MNIGLQITKNEKKFQNLLKVLIDQLDHKNTYNFIHIKNEESLLKICKDLNILVCYSLKENLFSKKLENLEWIHFGAAGIFNSLHQQLLKSKIIVTNAKGIHATPVSEFVFGAMLYFAKQFQGCTNFMKNREWIQWDLAKNMMQLSNKKIGIIGYGKIGRAIGKRAKAFGMKVIATRRLQKKIEISSNLELIPTSDINYLYKESDFVVIACPLTHLTKEMITLKQLKIMKSSSILINIARGQLIKEKDLIEALTNKMIRGAFLDVFSEEPLNNKSKFFDLENVMLSPHVSGNFPEYQQEMIIQFANNLNRFHSNKALINRVCKKRLY